MYRLRFHCLVGVCSVVALAGTAGAAEGGLREKTAQIIAAAQADDVFEVVDADEEAVVRHPASGLKCFFGIKAQGSIVIHAKEPRGSHVACSQDDDHGQWTVAARRRERDDWTYGSVGALMDTLKEEPDAKRGSLNHHRSDA